MAYRITYESVEKPKSRFRLGRKGWVATALVLVLVLGAMAVKNSGLDFVKTYLLPGDPAVTAAALEDLAEDLQQGESLIAAFRAFCEEIIEHGTKMQLS